MFHVCPTKRKVLGFAAEAGNKRTKINHQITGGVVNEKFFFAFSLIFPWLVLGGIVLAFFAGYIPAQFVPLFSGIILLLSFLQVLWKKHKNPKQKLGWIEYLELIFYPLVSLLSFYTFWLQISK